MLYIETNIYTSSFFCVGFLVTKSCPNLICLGKQGRMEKRKQFRINMLGKARKDGKTKTVFGMKRICDAIVDKF